MMTKFGGCAVHKVTWVLVVIGGLNWGLVGLGSLINGTPINAVSMILGGYPTIEAVVYLIVGVATVAALFGCRCKQCKMQGGQM